MDLVFFPCEGSMKADSLADLVRMASALELPLTGKRQQEIH